MIDVGVGSCSKREAGLGHVWASWSVDPRRPCMFCGRPGRDDHAAGERGGYFAEATMARMELFDGLRAPASAHGKAAKS